MLFLLFPVLAGAVAVIGARPLSRSRSLVSLLFRIADAGAAIGAFIRTTHPIPCNTYLSKAERNRIYHDTERKFQETIPKKERSEGITKKTLKVKYGNKNEIQIRFTSKRERRDKGRAFVQLVQIYIHQEGDFWGTINI